MIASMYVYPVDSPTADFGRLSQNCLEAERHPGIGCVHGIVQFDVICSDGEHWLIASMDDAANVPLYQQF